MQVSHSGAKDFGKPNKHWFVSIEIKAVTHAKVVVTQVIYEMVS